METSFWSDSKTWVAISFFVFFIVFGKKLWKPLAALLDSRADLVRAELEEAARLRREAENMLRDAQLQRDRAVEDAQRLVAGAQAEAERLAVAAAQDAETATRRREQMALDRIAAAEKAAVDQVRLTAADLATTAAREVIAESLSPGADATLIDTAIRQLPAALRAA
ncbi:MAG TPA: F0F1 ATP synthase subunit B [Acetobacteraceae bacterium]